MQTDRKGASTRPWGHIWSWNTAEVMFWLMESHDEWKCRPPHSAQSLEMVFGRLKVAHAQLLSTEGGKHDFIIQSPGGFSVCDAFAGKHFKSSLINLRPPPVRRWPPERKLSFASHCLWDAFDLWTELQLFLRADGLNLIFISLAEVNKSFAAQVHADCS